MERSPKKRGGNLEGALTARLKEALTTSNEPDSFEEKAKAQDLEILALKKAKIIAAQKQFDKDPAGTTYHLKDRRIRALERNIPKGKPSEEGEQNT